jgi:hypothetical protein
MKHPATRILFDYWDRLRGERSAPDRGEIEPGAIRHILADTFVLEIDETGAPSFRLAGTRLCALFCNEMKATPFIPLWAQAGRQEISNLVAAVMDEAAGIVGGVSGQTQGGKNVDLELLLLPLRHRGRTHTRMLGALSPAIIPPWLGLEPIVSLSTLSLRVIWPSGREEGTIDHAAERRRHFIVHRGGRL